MKNKMENAWKALLSNRGSGLAMIMMAMTLLSLLAAALLNMTYMGYKIKAEDRKQKEDYIIATVAMDEIRAGLQGVASDAIAETYKEVLPHSSDDITTPEGNEAFRNNLQQEFLTKTAEMIKVSNILFDDYYDTIKLRGMVKTSGNFTIDYGRYNVNAAATEVILNNISLTYTNSAENEIIVKTDIVISAPSFAAEWDYNKLVQYRNWSIE